MATKLGKGMSRRGLLRGGAGLTGLSLVSGSVTTTAFQALMSRPAGAAPINYPPPVPTADGATGLNLISLPPGFSYVSYGWTRDPMRDGTPTPSAHDGMDIANVSGGGRFVTLVRNHEQGGSGGSFGRPQITYDPAANGGTTNLLFDTVAGKFVHAWASLSGTIRNCAGGATPWGSWLTCEENLTGIGGAFAKTHGWVFNVPATGVATPVPIEDMGRFNHEATATDPNSGYVYETEDRTPGGFYRYIPTTFGDLAGGGTLWMMKTLSGGTPVTNMRGRGAGAGGTTAGQTYDVEWVQIDDPTKAHNVGTDGGGVVSQGLAQDGADFSRPEGCWYNSGKIYFACTNGGAASQGQIFEYDPVNETLKTLYVSPGSSVLSNPDNIAVHEKRGIVLCEDGSATPSAMHFLNFQGEITRFAQNLVDLRPSGLGPHRGFSSDFRGSEWCGACWSPDGKWLFANIQSPGITFAITGPWEDISGNV